VEKGRSEAAKETRKELRKWKTPAKLHDIALQELGLWKSRNLRSWSCHGLFVPEMLVPEGILVKIAKNARRIACEDMKIRDIIGWGSYKQYRLDNAEDTAEDVIKSVWESLKDEITQDELNAKEAKKAKAAETRKKNRARISKK